MKTAMTWVMGGLLAVGAATFAGLSRHAPGADAATAAADRRAAPDFTLPSFQDGRPIRLADHRGEVVLVNFWATWCPPCRHEIPGFIQVQRDLRPKGFEIVGISLDEGGARDVASDAVEALL